MVQVFGPTATTSTLKPFSLAWVAHCLIASSRPPLVSGKYVLKICVIFRISGKFLGM